MIEYRMTEGPAKGRVYLVKMGESIAYTAGVKDGGHIRVNFSKAPYGSDIMYSSMGNRMERIYKQPVQPQPLSSPAPTPTPLDKQVGGSHYALPIQPVEYITKNEIPYLEGNVIKYVTRHAAKNGAQDIDKAIHYLEMIKEIHYGTNS